MSDPAIGLPVEVVQCRQSEPARIQTDGTVPEPGRPADDHVRDPQPAWLVVATAPIPHRVANQPRSAGCCLAWGARRRCRGRLRTLMLDLFNVMVEQRAFRVGVDMGASGETPHGPAFEVIQATPIPTASESSQREVLLTPAQHHPYVGGEFIDR